jgi:hypothetical protein
VKERTKRFYNNVNSKTLKSIEELVTAIAAMHNIIRAGGNTKLIVPVCSMGTTKEEQGPNLLLTMVPYLCTPVNDNFSEFYLDIKGLL